MSANSWEPEHHLSCAHLIQKFETKLQTRKGTRKRTKCNVRGHRHGKTFEKKHKIISFKRKLQAEEILGKYLLISNHIQLVYSQMIILLLKIYIFKL